MNNVRTCALAIALAIPFLCAWRLSEFGNTVVVQMAIGILIAAGLHVLVHWAGQISLAQVALMGVGAFVTARANADFGVPLPLAVAPRHGRGGGGQPRHRPSGVADPGTGPGHHHAGLRLRRQPLAVPAALAGPPGVGHPAPGYAAFSGSTSPRAASW